MVTMVDRIALHISEFDNVERFVAPSSGMWRGYLFSTKYNRCEDRGECVCDLSPDNIWAERMYLHELREARRSNRLYYQATEELAKPIFEWQGASCTRSPQSSS